MTRCRHDRDVTVVEDYVGSAHHVFVDGELVESEEAVVSTRRRFIDFECSCGFTWRGDPFRASAPPAVRLAACRLDKALRGE